MASRHVHVRTWIRRGDEPSARRAKRGTSQRDEFTKWISCYAGVFAFGVVCFLEWAFKDFDALFRGLRPALYLLPGHGHERERERIDLVLAAFLFETVLVNTIYTLPSLVMSKSPMRGCQESSVLKVHFSCLTGLGHLFAPCVVLKGIPLRQTVVYNSSAYDAPSFLGASTTAKLLELLRANKSTGHISACGKMASNCFLLQTCRRGARRAAEPSRKPGLQ